MPQCRPLGQTGMEVSVIGLGTVKLGRTEGVKYPHSFQLPDDTQLDTLLQTARELGVNLLDTAPAYGKSEERLGEWLKKTGSRPDWIISTKFGENFENGVSSFSFAREAAIQSIDRSLKRLHTDYLDLVLVHSDGNDLDIIQQYDVFNTLSHLKQAGKIRAYGMSTKTAAGGLAAVERADVVMVTHHPAHTVEQSVIARAHQLQKGVLVKKALASGHLNQISDTSPVETAIQFVLSEPGVSSIVIGTLNPLHLQEAVRFAGEQTHLGIHAC